MKVVKQIHNVCIQFIILAFHLFDKSEAGGIFTVSLARTAEKREAISLLKMLPVTAPIFLALKTYASDLKTVQPPV